MMVLPVYASRCRRSHPRDGFTLIEVLVALTIGALVVLMVHQSFGSAADLGAALDESRASHRRRMDAEARLVQAFGSVEVAVSGTNGFQGRTDRVQFWSAPDQRARARSVTIGVQQQHLVMRVGATPPESLLAVEGATFDYLLSYGADAGWVREWHSPLSAPLAVRMRVQRPGGADTLLFFIGPRG